MAGPGLAILGVIGQLIANKQQQDLNWANLRFQQRNADEQRRLATATQTDAYGNKTRYNPSLNEWEQDLTPEQKSLLEAMQHEQQQELSVDAPQARELRARQDARSRAAGEDYNRAEAGYRYDQPQSEQADIAEALNDATISRREGVGNATAALARQALRMGEGRSIPQLLKSANDTLGNAFDQDMVNAKARGRQRFREDTAGHGRYLTEMTQLANVMDDVGRGPMPNVSGIDAGASARESSMLQAIGAALGNEATQVGNAYGRLANGVQPLDFSGLIKALTTDDGTISAPVYDPFAPTTARRTVATGGGSFFGPQGNVDDHRSWTIGHG